MSRLRVPVGPGDHVAGPADAPITLVEYGDFQCPHCGAAYPEVMRLKAMLGDRMRLVFRNFPLAEQHPYALLAAEAAESAGAQRRFWKMHERLFENQQSLDRTSLIEYAGELELDTRRFTLDLDTERFAEKIRRDFLGGARSGVNGTPTFFINDVRHDGGYDAESILDTIEGRMPERRSLW